MVRWEDIHPRERASFEERLAGRYTAPFEETPWAEAPDLADARVAIVTTAAHIGPTTVHSRVTWGTTESFPETSTTKTWR